MGREIKRVALDFDWPLKKVWPGFLVPDHSEGQRADCPTCQNGSGLSKDAKFFQDQWYGNAPFDPAETGSKPFTPEAPAVYRFAWRNVRQGMDYYLGHLRRGDSTALFTRTTDSYSVLGWEAFKNFVAQRMDSGGNLSPWVKDAILAEANRLCGHFNSSWMHHLGTDDIRALIEEDRLWDFTRIARTPEQRAAVEVKVAGGGNSWLPGSNGYIPTPEEVNTWRICGFGHDSINSWTCIKAKCKRFGVEYDCQTCHGHGTVWTSEEARLRCEAADEAWEGTEPPAGEGWQLWETVSDGSPVSPVFETPHQLIDFLVKTDGYSLTAAQNFVLGSGWTPSAMSIGGKFYQDIEAYGHHDTLLLAEPGHGN